MKRWLVLSGKGGTGKTTISAALIALSHAKAVADCDVDAPNLHLVTHQSNPPKIVDFTGGDKAVVDEARCIGCGICVKKCRFDAIQVVDGCAKVNEYSCEGCGVCQLVCNQKAVSLFPDVAGSRSIYQDETSIFSTATLKMGRGNSGKLVSEVKLAMLSGAPDCELAIMDGSPGIGCPVMASASGMDLVLLVVEPSESGISDMKRLVETLSAFDMKMAVCVNKYDTSPQHTDKITAYCAEMGIHLVGHIPFDATAIEAVNGGKTIVDMNGPAGEAVRVLYQNLSIQFK